MLSKNQIKLITSLQQKKYRKLHQLFLVEGIKVIQELLNSNFELEHLFVTSANFSGVEEKRITIITEADLKKISALTTPNNCLGVFKIPKSHCVEESGLIMVLDDLRDPGNMGTILRLCDWFGIHQVVCSLETVDVYNPKVVQATMGSITRVRVTYTDLEVFLKKSKLPIFGTYMDGANIYKTILPEEGIIVMGNEANGISLEVSRLIKNRLSIPRFGQLQQTESLNVATAASIVLSEFKRMKC